MILDALVELYDALEQRGSIAAPGWSQIPISFALDLDTQGELRGILDLRVSPEGGKGKPRPRIANVPFQMSRANGIAPHFLCDTSKYLLGLDDLSMKAKRQKSALFSDGEELDSKEEKKIARTKKCFEESAVLHKSLLEADGSITAQAICRFFDNWDYENPLESEVVSRYYEDLIMGNIVFRIDGEFAQEDQHIIDIWNSRNESKNRTDDEPVMGICSVQGVMQPIARLHGLIKGVAGSQSSGAALVSYNAPAFESYGKAQSYNASVGEEAAFKYVSALNYLLSNREHVKNLGNTTIVYWAATGEEAYQTAYDGMMGGFSKFEDTPIDNELLDSVMARIVVGKDCSLRGVSLSPTMPFYVLGLSPNAARLSVRFFYESSFGAMVENINQHYERLAIVRPRFDERVNLRVYDLLGETVNKKEKTPKPDPMLEGSLTESILDNSPYPSILYSEVLQRIRAESGAVTRGRAAIIKAYLMKNVVGLSAKMDEYRKVCAMSLQEDSDFLPYNIGRLFAICEEVQEDSLRAARGGSTSEKAPRTIKDTYLVSASMRPSAIFPRILSLNTQHMRVLQRENPGQAVHVDKKLGQVLRAINQDHFPVILNSYEQGAFYLGYYEQRQSRFEIQTDKNKTIGIDENNGKENK